jgi:hypothetical protein
VRADRRVTGGTRFKTGHALVCDRAHALMVSEPREYGLPLESPAQNYLFAKEDYFFVYHHGRHEHERLLRGSFQHGGISLEEMIVPLATLHPPAGR